MKKVVKRRVRRRRTNSSEVKDQGSDRGNNSTYVVDVEHIEEEIDEESVQYEEELKAEEVNQFRINVRYCKTCCRYKAPRTFHCQTCQACIDGYDHHCAFTGTCIGTNNYPSFIAFLYSLQSYIFFAFIAVVAGPVDFAKNSRVCLKEATAAMGGMNVLMIILIFGITFGVTGLMILHTHLIIEGLNTQEHLREKYLGKPNPFDRGFIRNVLRAFGKVDKACFTATYDVLIEKFDRQRKEAGM